MERHEYEPDRKWPALESGRQPDIRHVLPGEESGKDDVSWFSRQNTFEQAVIRRQVKFKREVLGIFEDARFSKQPHHLYSHILPEGMIRQAFYPGFADELIEYLKEEEIHPHSELLNLKRSQAACLNFLFPLRLDNDLAAGVLARAGIIPSSARVTALEFEHTAQNEKQGEHGCTEWLGEPKGGKRGQNRTSIDGAIFWTQDDRKCATLVEWKYTERSFGS